MRRVPMFILAAMACAPLWAMHCPMDMAKIDERLASNPPSDPAVLEQVRKLRVEGEELHKAGNHAQSVQVLGQAQELLDAAP